MEGIGGDSILYSAHCRCSRVVLAECSWLRVCLCGVGVVGGKGLEWG